MDLSSSLKWYCLIISSISEYSGLILTILCFTAFHNLNYLRKLSVDVIIVVTYVWSQTINARLYPTIGIGKITATLIPQTIKRTITKQTIEILRIVCLMTWEIFTFSILKEFVMLHSSIISKKLPVGSKLHDPGSSILFFRPGPARFMPLPITGLTSYKIMIF